MSVVLKLITLLDQVSIVMRMSAVLLEFVL